MTRFDRYILNQHLMLFGFFALVLVSVYWVNRAVKLFDQLIASGQSAWVFLEFTALTLPNVMRLVLPAAAFAASLYVTNRLRVESELVVVHGAGQSPGRLARPVLIFGAIAALLVSILVHALVPASAEKLQERSGEIARNVTAGLLSEGTFLTPVEGVTVYIRDITPDGELREIFLSDDRSDRQRTDYTATRARLVDDASGPKLVMFDGMVQTFERSDRRLAVTRFDDFAYDLGTLIDAPTGGQTDPDIVSTPTLIAAGPDVQEATGKAAPRLVFEAHYRFSQGLFTLIAPILGFAILATGRFSRFGAWPRIAAAIVLLVLIDTTRSAAFSAAENVQGLWPVAYVAPLLAAGAAVAILWWDARHTHVGEVPV